MAWQSEPTSTPTTLDLHIELHDLASPEEGQPAKSAGFRIRIYDQDSDEMRRFAGDLAPHLEGNEQQQLLDFMATLRARAETQLLGG